MADRDEAEVALFDAIVEGAKSAAAEKKADFLKEVALAFSHVVHGPQGGGWDADIRNNNKQDTDYRYSSETDYHETRHQGEDRERPPAGFSDRGEGHERHGREHRAD